MKMKVRKKELVTVDGAISDEKIVVEGIIKNWLN
jgi:hypothetical protein